MNNEKKRLISSLILPSVLIIVIWLIKLGEFIMHTDFGFWGIYPLKIEGLAGILFSPLIHSDLNHLYANTIPLFLLSTALFYFYREIGFKILMLIYFTTNFWVWIVAREAWHIGASGLIYGLFSFIFISGIIRKNNRLMALSMFIIFLYGGLIWGIFPNNIQREISWESHLMGLISGIVFAVYYKNEGPQKTVYQWEEDDNEDDDDKFYMNYTEEENPDDTNKNTENK